MLIFIKILFAVYIISINVYGFMLIKLKKNQYESPTKGNGKFLICALLGGSLGVFIGMFVFNYRLDSLILMVFIPLLFCVNVFICWCVYRYNFGFDIDYLAVSMPLLIKMVSICRIILSCLR